MNRLTYTIPKDHLTSAQHRKATESTPEHIVFSGKTAGGDVVTYRMDPDDFWRHADHLLAARVEELLTVNENEVNDALASSHDALREVGACMVAIRAGIRRRFRSSTGTPAIEDFNADPEHDPTLLESAGGYVLPDTGSTPEDMDSSDEAIDGGSEEG